MMNEHIPIIDLLACQMDTDSLATLSAIFCENRPFARFVDLYTWVMAGLPESERVVEFWQEVGDLGYFGVS